MLRTMEVTWWAGFGAINIILGSVIGTIGWLIAG